MKEKNTCYCSVMETAEYTPNVESLEEKIARQIASKEPIESIAPLMFTERKDGVRPEFDIRTDRFEIAVEAGDKLHATYLAQRDNNASVQTTETKTE